MYRFFSKPFLSSEATTKVIANVLNLGVQTFAYGAITYYNKLNDKAQPSDYDPPVIDSDMTPGSPPPRLG